MSDTAPFLREPWQSFERQRAAAHFGIWVFLASEMLFFGALLLAYTVCRIDHIAAFQAAALQTNIVYGTLNTVILLTSSVTMAVAAQGAAAGQGLRAMILACLLVTALLGAAFLVVKGFEYREDIEKHLVPGSHFALQQAGAQLFFGLYWIITGVHAIHLTIGIILVGRLALLGYLDRVRLDCNPELGVTALYWHLVDVIWIFLYPLIYLPGRST